MQSNDDAVYRVCGMQVSLSEYVYESKVQVIFETNVHHHIFKKRNMSSEFSTLPFQFSTTMALAAEEKSSIQFRKNKERECEMSVPLRSDISQNIVQYPTQ